MNVAAVIFFMCQAIIAAGNLCGHNAECELALEGKRMVRTGSFLCTKKHEFTCVDKVCVCGRPDKCTRK